MYLQSIVCFTQHCHGVVIIPTDNFHRPIHFPWHTFQPTPIHIIRHYSETHIKKFCGKFYKVNAIHYKFINISAN